MKPAPTSAASLTEAAMQALKRGDQGAARRLAERAASLDPQAEQPWLVLAYLAAPGEMEAFLQRALQANPNSRRARAGLEWFRNMAAQGRLQLPVAPAVRPGEAVVPSLPSAGQPLPHPGVLTAPRTASVRPARPAGRVPRGVLWLALLALLVVSVAILGAANYPAEAQPPARAKPSESLKATLTATLTPSQAPTAAPTDPPTLTATLTPTASPTPTFTFTPTATNTPTVPPTRAPAATSAPTEAMTRYRVVAGDTLATIAQRFNVSISDLADANGLVDPSVIWAGQVLAIPGGGRPATNPTTLPPPAAGGSKEIQVDISEQRLYAYENQKLVFSLVVSTGIGNSTRIGTFKVLDKIPRAFSQRFNIWMPWWLGIYYSGTLENGIHGLPLLMNGVELWGNLLGKPATYGCIEARTNEIKMLYDWAEIGTPVIIRN